MFLDDNSWTLHDSVCSYFEMWSKTKTLLSIINILLFVTKFVFMVQLNNRSQFDFQPRPHWWCHTDWQQRTTFFLQFHHKFIIVWYIYTYSIYSHVFWPGVSHSLVSVGSSELNVSSLCDGCEDEWTDECESCFCPLDSAAGFRSACFRWLEAEQLCSRRPVSQQQLGLIAFSCWTVPGPRLTAARGPSHSRGHWCCHRFSIYRETPKFLSTLNFNSCEWLDLNLLSRSCCLVQSFVLRPLWLQSFVLSDFSLQSSDSVQIENISAETVWLLEEERWEDRQTDRNTVDVTQSAARVGTKRQ